MLENIVGKTERKGSKDYSQELCSTGLLKRSILQPFTKRQKFGRDQITSTCRRFLSLIEKKTLWEKEKMLVTIIFPFPTVFSKAFFFTVKFIDK